MSSGVQRLAARLRQKTAAPHALQLQLSQQIPGTPFMLRGGEIKEERLPGMRRWVDRDTVQRVFSGLEAGESPESIVQDEVARGQLLHPAIGAGIGALASTELASRIPQLGSRGPLAAALLAALTGGAAGAAYNYAGRDKREQDAREALEGAQLEMAKFPRHRGHAVPMGQADQGTASAATPTLLSSAPTNW